VPLSVGIVEISADPANHCDRQYDDWKLFSVLDLPLAKPGVKGANQVLAGFDL
jgi:hypothetical protein